MNPELNFFPLGASYYPPFHSADDWVRDVERMAAARLNVIRTGELIASWEWLEPQKGRFDFGWLDRIFDLTHQYGLRVLLGTGAGSPPLWLRDLYPDVQIVSQDGITYPTGTMWGWACIHHPGFRAESERYLRTLLARYRAHPALLGWQIHNEPGYPAHQRHAGGPPEIYCYCQHSAAAFREWVRAKYGDVETLSEAWACTPTRHRYHDWSQVQPPRSAPTAWGSPGAWLDWRQYIAQSFADFIAWQNQIIKESDSVHPTTTNLIHLLDQHMGVIGGIDPWLYSSASDVLGLDLYPVNRFKAEPFYTSIQLDYARSPALHASQPFWIPEIESGPIGGWVLGPNHPTNARDLRRYNLDCLAHGAKLLLYQGYREWDPLPLHWGALVDLNGEPTERYDEAARLNQIVQQYENLFLEAQPPRAQIGILVDQRNAIVNVGMGAGEMLFKAIKGIYRACWSYHYPVEFITPELLAAGQGDHYRLLLMPFMMVVTPTCAQAVTNFVARGGIVAGFAKCGMINEKSFYWHDRPGGLTAVFGVKEQCIARIEEITVSPIPDTPIFAGVTGPLAGYWHRQDFHLSESTQVLAHYPDGAAAVTLHRCGQGQAILFGTHLDVAALAEEAVGQRQVLANLAEWAGVERPFSLDGSPVVDGHLLAHGTERLFIVINHGPAEARVKVSLPPAPAANRVTDLFTGQRVTTEVNSAGLHFALPLDAYDSTALLIE